jgi:hypothetical protein
VHHNEHAHAYSVQAQVCHERAATGAATPMLSRLQRIYASTEYTCREPAL